MVSVTINSFKDEESMPLYELPEGSSVLDLKTEIEATEGIPIGHQRLVYREKELQDNEDLDSLIRSLPFEFGREPPIHLIRAQISLHLKSLQKPQDTVESHETPEFQEKIIQADVDLDGPIRPSLPWYIEMFFGKDVRPSSLKLFFLNVDQALIHILDIDQTFSHYGICHGNTIHIVYEAGSFSFYADPPQCYREPSPSHPSLDSDTIVLRAKHNWDGDIMRPYTAGLSLKRNTLIKVSPTSHQPGWLYGTPLNLPPVPMTSSKSLFARRNPEGCFPEAFVSPLVEDTEEDLETADDSDMLDIPPLPPYQFPPATRMTFHMPFSDKGHLFLRITANYEILSSPIDPTQVTMTLWCPTYDIRRISSISLFIETPETTVLDVEVCSNEAHREEIHTEKGVIESRSKQTNFDGVNIGTHGTTVEFQGVMSSGHSIGSTERGSRVSRRKVDAGIYNDRTVFWNLKAPMTRLGEDGLSGEESIAFILMKKPVQFRYKCRVTHSRDGVEKTTQRVSKSTIFDSPLPSWLD